MENHPINMHSPDQTAANSRKRNFAVMNYQSKNVVNSCDDDENAAVTEDLIPRGYQRKIFEVAMRRNTIAVLETGSGKTMIAVMLIRETVQAMKLSGKRRLIIFLAPTVHLVHQQFKVIRDRTGFKVAEYYGALGVDDWNLETWKKEISNHEVLVMTPQILLNALGKGFIRLTAVSLMIIDECHRATKSHPYAKIMEGFYRENETKPKIFGLTASPVIKKGVSSSVDCEGQLSNLESLLDSQIFTVGDRTELEVFVPSAEEKICFYSASPCPNSILQDKMESLWSKYDDLLIKLQKTLPNNYKDMDDKFKTLRKRLSNDHAKILHCLNDLGLICACEAVKVCIENAPHSIEECDLYRESTMQCKYYLEEVLCIIEDTFPRDLLSGFLVCSDQQLKDRQEIQLGYLSPKLLKLIQIFRSFGDDGQVLCLIFVDRIITAKVIERFMKQISLLSHFTASYLAGSNSSVDPLAPKVQTDVLESFRSGKVNLLFSTDVVEEGINVPNCSCVIRFDLPKTVRSYVQSRGRARQNDSRFIMMLERGNQKQRDQVFDIIRSELSMTDASTNRDPNTCVLKACSISKMDTYVVPATGASIAADSSAGLIRQYCDKLPRDKYFTPEPTYETSMHDGLYWCKLTLPPNAVFKTIVGPGSKSSQLSKQRVCLEACKKLHQMGALDEHLVAFIESPSRNDIIVNNKESGAGAGTTKRKELHGTTYIRALSGGWGDKIGEVIFQAYQINFSWDFPDGCYSNFVLLIESKLDDDVGNAEMDLFMHSNNLVKASVSQWGQVHLDAEQVDRAKRFQELFFNGLFGKLFIGSKSSRDFLLKADGKSLWDPSNMYLLLPLSSSSSAFSINWAGIHSTADVVDFLKKSGEANGNDFSRRDSLFQRPELVGSQTNFIRFSNRLVHADNLEQQVVLATHTGRIYSVVEVLTDMNANSPFDGSSDLNPRSFAKYFEQQYGIVLSYPLQPLLLLKQSHNPHNLLTNFSEGKPVTDKPREYIRMPPELLVKIDVSIGILKSFYLLPSVMHRLESLMLASQLREEISCQLNNCRVSSSLVLEALTSLRCCESFSMERLELLGDSVLKYAVSCHLFLKYPKKHEGQLSARRSWAVCNSTLHKLGTDRKLQGYIRDGAFDPRRWLAPGQHSIRPVPCQCGVSSMEVPLDSKFFSEDPQVVLGKACDKGHRWMGSKTVSDCVESLIGAYYVAGGLNAALHLMKWLGIDVEIQPSLVDEAIHYASFRSYKPEEIQILELKIGCKFSVKGLLQEAITHATEQEVGVSFCYQRLEFLGDSVLDLLITRHLYQKHTNVDPGELTDLRSACVNNENFAQAAVRHNLQKHLQHGSGLLLTQIRAYEEFLSTTENTRSMLEGAKGPKVLGDLIESIAGAILIDTKLNLDEVWKIFEPLLSPLVTPDKLELPPLRELIELCDSLGYFIKETCTKKKEVVHAELSLQLKDVLLVRQGSGQNRKAAKALAALRLLKDLEGRGISYSRSASKRRNQDPCNIEDSSTMDLNAKILGQMPNEKSSEPGPFKKPKVMTLPSPADGKPCSSKLAIPVIASINMNKGGPRTTLFDLCKKLQWPMPKFETTEESSTSPFTFEEGAGAEKRTGFNSFVSKIILHIPNDAILEKTGDARAEKKASYDSAALYMLYELQRLEKLIIGNPQQTS